MDLNTLLVLLSLLLRLYEDYKIVLNFAMSSNPFEWNNHTVHLNKERH